MKKNYSRPIALMETFTPNHYVASCEPQENTKYEVDPNGLREGVQVKYDKGQDGWYRQTDAGGADFTSNHLNEGASLYYIGRGWGDADVTGTITWPTVPEGGGLSEAEMAAEGIEYLYLFSNHPGEPTSHTGGIKVYGGKEIKEIIKPLS